MNCPRLTVAFVKLKEIQRIFQIAFDTVPVECVVTCFGSAEMPGEGGTGDGTQNASSKNNVARFACRHRVHTPQFVDEVIPGRQIVSVQFQFQRGIASAEITIELDLRSRGPDLAVSERRGSQYRPNSRM